MTIFVKRDRLTTEEQKILDETLAIDKEITDTVLALKRKKMLILRGHTHVISRRDLQSTDTSAICIICGENFGWWCEGSPNGFCEYSVSYDACDYCGKAEDRCSSLY